jgi:tyrosinase
MLGIRTRRDSRLESVWFHSSAAASSLVVHQVKIYHPHHRPYSAVPAYVSIFLQHIISKYFRCITIMRLSTIAAVGSLLSLGSTAPAPSSSAQRRDWDDWSHSGGNWGDWGKCTPEKMRTRVDFASMPPEERKAFTDAMKCIMAQPSNLDTTQFPAAINRWFDYATVHVGRTNQVHISGFFLTWHRYFNFLMEQDLRHTCGYTGRWPYWNFAATAQNIEDNPVFDGSAYSMSGNGILNDTGPIVLGPNLVIPHGTGGGCVTTGPFANMITTLGFIEPLVIASGTLPPNAYAYNASCLTRDLNQYVSSMFTNMEQVINATHAHSQEEFELSLNGIIGGSALGIHSGAHFSIGGIMNSVHVSAQDPIWYPLHTFIDVVYTSWQKNNPEIFDQMYGTETALNIPPSPNVTLDSVLPDWGYFSKDSYTVRDLISTTGGPFCYDYDLHIQ